MCRNTYLWTICLAICPRSAWLCTNTNAHANAIAKTNAYSLGLYPKAEYVTYDVPSRERGPAQGTWGETASAGRAGAVRAAAGVRGGYNPTYDI